MFRHSTKPAKGDNTFKQLFGRHGSKSPANVSATSQVSNISLSTTGSLSSSGNLVPTLTTAQSKLWDKAVSRLSQTDRDTIDFTNPDKVGILEEVELEAQRSEQLCVEKQWKFLWKGEDVFLKDVASKLVGWISKFTDIGDIVIQYDPGHSAIPWAGFRLLLKVFPHNVVFRLPLTLTIMHRLSLPISKTWRSCLSAWNIPLDVSIAVLYMNDFIWV